MIILDLGSDGIVVKRTIDAVEHVRADQFGIAFWGGTERVGYRTAAKPYCEFDINECRDLLKELDKKVAAAKKFHAGDAPMALAPTGKKASMKSNLVNEYGAFHGELVDHVSGMLVSVYNELAGIADGLDPIDAILLESHVIACLRVRFAEDRLRRAMKMRKAERQGE